MQRIQSERTESARIDLANRKTILLARIAERIDSKRLLSSELKRIDPSLSRKMVSRLRDRDTTVCSLERLMRLADALEVFDALEEELAA